MIWVAGACAVTPLWAFAFSLHIYKIWYIYTAFSAVIILAIIPLGLRTGGIAIDILPFCLYFLWVFASAFVARNSSVTLHSALIDLIFPVVFCLGYIAAANNGADKIAALMAFTIIPLCLSSWLFFDKEAGRIGLRAYEVAPFIVPFAVYLIYQGKPLAYLSLFATLGFLALTQSRTPIAAGFGAFVISVLWMAPSTKRFIQLITVSAILCAAVTPFAMRSATAELYVAHTLARITGHDIELENETIEGEGADPVRENINELSLDLLKHYNPLGIGYENFPLYYLERFGDDVVLHSMYATWVIELGIPGVLFALFIVAEAMRRVWFGMRKDNYWRVLAVGLMVAAALGIFHQAHQSPGLWLMLGIVFGLADHYFRQRAYKVIVPVAVPNLVHASVKPSAS